MENRKAIAVISFGTTYVDNAEKSIKAIENDVANTFSDYTVTSAYTSTIVKATLASKGVEVPSPEECFEGLLAQGIKDLIVLPTHIIAGEEYRKLVACTEAFRGRFGSIKVCRPMVEPQDVPTIIDTLLAVFNVPSDEFLVFMGHGSPTEANEIYHLMNQELTSRGVERMYISTVEATPKLINAIDLVKAYNPKKVTLTPLMLVSGEHANHDMDMEWKSAFDSRGFNTECILKGLGEYPQFRKVYLDRVSEVLC